MSRILATKTGFIRGDDADQWLRENDPWRFSSEKGKRNGAVRIPPTFKPGWELELRDVEAPARDELLIYFVQGETGGPVKIGRTEGPHRLASRLASVQTGNPDRVVIRRVVAGDHRVERALHALFADLRLRPDGEWFRVDERLAALARAVQT